MYRFKMGCSIFFFLILGSDEQKEVVERANKLCGWKYPALTITPKADVDFKLEGGPDKNGDFCITLRMRNTVGEGRIADVYIGALSVFYTGVTAEELKRVTSNVLLDPKTGTCHLFVLAICRFGSWFY